MIIYYDGTFSKVVSYSAALLITSCKKSSKKDVYDKCLIMWNAGICDMGVTIYTEAFCVKQES